MLSSLLNDQVDVVSAENNPPFDTLVDYDKIVQEHKLAVKEWAALGKEGQKQHGNFKAFLREKGVQDPKSEELLKCKNYSLLKNEIYQRVYAENTLELLPIPLWQDSCHC